MIIPILITLLNFAFAQDENLDLSAITNLNEQLPNYSVRDIPEKENARHRIFTEHMPPKTINTMDEIRRSAVEIGSIREGSKLIEINSTKTFILTQQINVRFHTLEDGLGFKYIVDKDGTCRYKVLNEKITSVKEVSNLIEPPPYYAPATIIIVKQEYDQGFNLDLEASFYSGVVQGDFMRDLFDDPKANKGLSNQFGAHLLGNWNLPIKAGLGFHFEKAEYRLSQNGFITYSAFSFGPQFKTKTFDWFLFPFRLQSQFRVGPYARATAQTELDSVTFRFNSADSLSSFEFPIKNRFGEFVLGLYVQVQWLSIKDQSQNFSVKSSNQSNKSWGLSLSQVFE